MGIKSLLPFIKKASREANIKEYAGKVAAVDAYGWLYKGAFAYAEKLVRGEQTDGYVSYAMKMVNLLINKGITPILVFDGCHLPSKAGTEAKRRENKQRNRKKAMELMREGKIYEARDYCQRCVDVTSEMASQLIKACRARNVDTIVAPYEADAQLAYLNLSGIAQVVITEDSDLVAFGCTSVGLFKMDTSGRGVLVEKEKLHLSMNLPRDKFSFSTFQNMCILGGCDYLPSLPGIGLGRACKFFTLTSDTDINRVLTKLPSYLKMSQLEVTKEYCDGFVQAVNTFKYQLVFDPITRHLRPLNSYPEHTGPEDYPYAGEFIGHEKALQIALGNINVQTGEVVDNYDPEIYEAPASTSSSMSHIGIWGNTRAKVTPAPTPSMVPSILPTLGKEVTVAAPLCKKRKLEVPEPESVITEGELANLYSVHGKQRKTEMSSKGYQDLQDKSLTPESEKMNSPETMEDKDIVECDETPANDSKSLHGKQTSKNPFAKSHSAVKSKSLSGTQFSALKKFSKMKRTVVDQNTVVLSRYFSSLVTLPSKSPSSESTPVCKTSEIEKSVSNAGDEKTHVEKESSLPHLKASPLSPVNPNMQSATPKTFKWSNLSEKFSENITVEASKASKGPFKSVTPLSQPSELKETSGASRSRSPLKDVRQHSKPSEIKENSDSSSQDTDTESPSSPYPFSQVSIMSDVGSVDNDSFNLSQTSQPLTPEVSQRTTVSEKDTSPRQHQPVPGKKSAKFGVADRGKCRAPGLRKSGNKKTGLDPKQQSLTDMFGFKK